MKELALVRIDDRLIHGQVVTAWAKETNCNRIIIIDDELAANTLMQRILKAAAPPGIKVEVMTVNESIIELKKEALPDERIIILVKIPQVLENLIDNGVKIEKIILGGMGLTAERKRFTKNVSATDEEIKCMKRIIEKGVSIDYQLVPSEKAVDIKKII